jgi:hypothetical protein
MATKIIFAVTLFYILIRAVGHSPVLHRASNAVIWLLSFLSIYRRIRFSLTRQHVHSSRLVKCRSLHSWPLREPLWCVPGNPIAVRHISAHRTPSCNSCTAKRRLVRGPPLPSCLLCLPGNESPKLPICRHTALKAFGWFRTAWGVAGTVPVRWPLQRCLFVFWFVNWFTESCVGRRIVVVPVSLALPKLWHFSSNYLV